MSPRLFEMELLLGAAAIAVWMRVRFPRLTPKSLAALAANILVAVGALTMVPAVIRLVIHVLPTPASIVVAIGAITVPALSYVLLSSIWLIGRLAEGGTPRGGHPIVDAR